MNNISDAKQRKLTLESLIQAAAAAPSASDSDLSALAEDLSRLGWLGVVTRANVASEAAPELNRASSLARELLTAKLGLVRVARKDLLEAREAADVASVEVERILKEVADADGQANADAVEKRTLRQTIQNIESIKAAQQVNAFGLIAELDRLKQEIGVLRPLIGGEDLPTDLPNWIQEQKQPLTDALVSARRQSTSLAAQVEELDARLAALRTALNATASMLVEIRALAKRLLEHNPNHTNCPVCSTAFDIGELERRLALTAAKTADDQTAIVLNTLEVIREQYASFDAMLRALTDLETYSKRRGLDPSVCLAQDILQEYHVQQASFKALQAQHGDITLRLSALSSAGLSDETIRTLQQAASRMDIDVLSQEEVALALSRESLALEQLDASTVQRSNERAALVSRMVIVVRGVEEVAEPIDTVVKAFRDRRTLIHSAVALIDELQTRFALGDEADIAAIAPLLDSAKVSAERFVKALESESNSRASEANAKQQLAQVESRITEHELAESRVQHAIEILSALEQEDSLLSATDAELLSVQAETNAVFGRIHSPHEYGVRRHAQAPLYRLEDPTQAVTLRDVSTGQRAAFVLSVFLAMNAKLQTAPPVLLFDDPVAHIDDFNSLSFLDHLRDIALEGKRQIFYATADNRLAGLFEHKFSFMKEKFRRFDLVR